MFGRENKKKQRENAFFYNPMKVTGALKEFGEEYNKKEAWLYYGAVLVLGIVLSLFFELPWYFFAFVIVIYLLCVPKLMLNQKKHAYELRRFHDVNAYMSQMAQSFIDTQDIIKSLEQTASSFSVGRMADTLRESIEIIENGSSDIVAAEHEALQLIQSRYDCEKIRNLHQYFHRAVERGGECGKEFSILEDTRRAWESAVKKFYEELKEDRLLGTLLYALTLGMCLVFMGMQEADMSIQHLLLPQVANTILLVIFILYFLMLDNRLNTSLLIDSVDMTKETADAYFIYLQQYNAKSERRKYMVYSMAFVIIGISFFVSDPQTWTLAVAIVLTVVGFNIHTIIFMLTRKILMDEISKAFPKWLFDIMLLIQRESVEGSIIMSVEKAPPVLQMELKRISNALEIKAHDADAYVSFMADFHLTGVEPAMRKLYTLAIGTGGVKEDVMDEIIRSNMEYLMESEKASIARKNDFQIVFQNAPVVIVTLGMLTYCVSLLYVMVDSIMAMF